jgi:acetyl esterase
MEWFFEHALNGPTDANDPRINLVAADLAGLPPTTIIAAEIDPLRSEGKLLAERLEQAGVDVGYTCYEGVTHEFFGMGLVVKDAAAAQSRTATALKKELRHGVLGKLADALT